MRITAWTFAATLSVLFVTARPAPAQERLVRVSLIDSVRTAAAGSSVSFMFMIESTDSTGGATEIVLPRGWRSLTEAGALPPRSRRTSYMLAAAVPSSAAAGRYPIDLVVRYGSKAVQSRAWAIVPTRRSLNLAVIDAPEMVVAGSIVSGLFRVTNSGNTPTRVKVVLSSPTLSWRDSVFVEMGSGGSRDIPVELKTDPRRRTLLQPAIHASARAVEEKGATASASFRVLVAPREAFAAAPIHAITSRARVIGTSGQSGGTGMELSGSGLLRDGSSARVEYLARRMSSGGTGFGDRDEYRMAVTAPIYSVVLGNDAYRLSSLSESGRFASGARAEVKSNGWTLGGFINRETALAAKPRQRALYLNRDFANGNLLAVNFLNKTERGGSSMLTARTSIGAIPFATIDAEVGHAINARPAEAWLVSARGRAERFSYSIFRQKTDAGYPGSTRGTESANVFLDARPSRRMQVRASFTENRFLRQDTTRTRDESHHWHYLSSVTLDGRYAVEYTHNGRQDRSFAAQPKRNEDLVTGRLSAGIAGAVVHASGAVGLATGGAAESRSVTRQPLARFAVSASARRGPNLSFSANVESLRGGTLFTPGQRAELRGGAGMAAVTGAGSRFSISGYASRSQTRKGIIGSTRQPRGDATLDLSWDQKLPSGHTFAVRARFHRNAQFNAADDDAVRVEYTVPFGFPIAPSQKRGRVAGRIHDVDTGRPVGGAMIQLGNQVTITDAKGRFAFSTDSEIPLVMNLAASAGTAGLIPVRDMPATVTPRMGRTSRFDIALRRAGRVEGKVRLYVMPPGFKPEGSPIPIEDTLGLPRARVELAREGEVRRTRSNGRGEFSFTDLRPGEWRLTVAGDDLPEFSYIEGDTVIVRVAPGGRTNAGIKVVPRRRKITIVQVR